VVTLAFVEVDPDAKAPADYVEEFGKGPFPFDYAVFTPATQREDPCAKLRERMKSRADAERKKGAATPAPAPPAPVAPATPPGPAP
jgi:hypothetical protein